MSLELPYSVKVLNPVPADFKIGPFYSVAQALLENDPGIRVQGLPTIVILAGQPYIYWFKDGIADSDFQPFVYDGAYSSTLSAFSNITVSGKLFYNTINGIGYVPGNIAYVNVTGGDDSTAVLGNQLRPFQSIGAAITAVGTLQNSAMFVFAGNYILTDANAPYGLKSPGSYYDIIFSPGSRVDYYGTYGMYISDANTSGNIYGYGDLRSHSNIATGKVDGVGNAAINIGMSTVSKAFEFYNIVTDSTSSTFDLMRIGDSGGTGASILIRGRALSRDRDCFFFDTNSRMLFDKINLIQNTSLSGKLINIVNPAELRIYNVNNTQAYAQAFGSNQNNAVAIQSDNNSIIEFDSCRIIAVSTTDPTYKGVIISSTFPGGVLNNLKFKNCEIKNKNQNNIGYNSTGYSFFTNNNISFKIVDTYGDQNTGGAGTITNLIKSGNGFMVEQNI